MPIDGQNESFHTIATKNLPTLMKKLRENILSAIDMKQITGPGIGLKTALINLKIVEDFPGCYVLLDDDIPYYVGISKKVITRLQQHVKGHNHFSASLAFKMAKIVSALPDEDRRTREQSTLDPVFKSSFESAKKRIHKSNFAFVEINDSVVLYLFEVYAAMELDTEKYNSFITH